ncbi:hypothetical protein ABIE21_000550 [Conyzicola nivalis]|uniref:Bacterial spore germination immunoglobulin-like domain-containing protein n=1 Tax=Conyzicola nivalis TaxID=1477021 RepID=A0ABV2QJ35_9MICO
MVRRRTISLIAVSATILAITACGDDGGTPPYSGSPPGASGTPTPTATAREPLIRIVEPALDATVTTPVALSGTANTFEAHLVVDAQNEAGDTLCIRHVSATSGSGTEGTWSTVLGIVPESDADAPIVLRAYERSPEDDSIANLVERPVTLSATRPVIYLTSPVCGDTVAPGGVVSVQGRATVFEAALTVDLRDAGGTVVFSRDLLTEEGGVESNFGELVTLPAHLPGGFYDLVAFSISAADGSIENEFPVQILVQ